MCGIAGLLHRGRLGDARARVEAMAASIKHRGPDDDGFWSDGDVVLGFRRLSIVDVETGHQPMSNEDGQVWVIFNGEIYNHQALRAELQGLGHRFATDHSDTEVLVHGYEAWGEALLGRLNGMFAFAIWDQRHRRLLLGRDRLGIKPLYLAETATGDLVFASEIRAILASGLVVPKPDHRMLYAYFQQQNTWRENTLFKGIEQLPAGHILIDDGRQRQQICYWDIAFHRRHIRPGEAAEALRATLQAALTRQIAADVPVMSYLSGGIDSSAIVAGAYRLDPRVKAYSCLFNLDGVGEDKILDEREFSRAVAAHLGISHVELELASTALIGSLRGTISALEEPRMGMAYVNFLIAERVAADSKVVLSGCGGDEILGGYVGRYAYVGRDALASTAPASLFQRLFGRYARPAIHPADEATNRMLTLYRFPVPPRDHDAAFTPEFRAAAGEYNVADALGDVLKTCPSTDIWDRLMYADAKTYLSGLLMVEDKLSMAHSLEARVPLLDNDMIDLALEFDWSLLCDGETGKKVFRDAVCDWVPTKVANKTKMGFGPPDASWYRGPLRPFILNTLSNNRIAQRGVFQPDYVAAALDEHMSGKANRIALIWSLLSFETWCDIQGFYGGDLGNSVIP